MLSVCDSQTVCVLISCVTVIQIKDFEEQVFLLFSISLSLNPYNPSLHSVKPLSDSNLCSLHSCWRVFFFSCKCNYKCVCVLCTSLPISAGKGTLKDSRILLGICFLIMCQWLLGRITILGRIAKIKMQQLWHH